VIRAFDAAGVSLIHGVVSIGDGELSVRQWTQLFADFVFGVPSDRGVPDVHGVV
jgi:hypothetical protein